ncbi:hypothetical protein KTT_24780 [Tengunoibacter tsumagoiensis]|uniref:Uncharacterized protein n=2 Tax=Tengunoibacter tsumagoiensis TaxID=2014871 RepID=A0A402A0N0_9CHLR|nr:hypothetical protein KTT_24780 [Tengunoibacter tsumagoiensis]
MIPQHSWRLLMRQAPYQIVIPSLAGLVMLTASFLPWLDDPLHSLMLAWQVPIDLAWPIHLGNYGLLCLCCSLLAGWIVWRRWQQPQLHGREARICQGAGLFSLLPATLFALQYLYNDMEGVALLNRNERQAMLIRGHFGYGSSAQFFPIQLSSLDPLDLSSRVLLFCNQVGPGFFTSLVGALLFFIAARQFPRSTMQQRRSRWTPWIVSGMAMGFLLLLGRGPAALICNYEAQHLLSIGNYENALTWLDYAQNLNPSLAQLPSYQLERGQAWYYVYPNQPVLSSRAYLASFYRQQNDFLSAYQELREGLMATHNQVPDWFTDEVDLTLQNLSEQPHPLNGAANLRVPGEEPSITWLNAMLQADPNNVYAHYMLGRLYYDLHDYTTCDTQMNVVLALSANSDIQSSAYTYLGLSKIGEGKYVEAHDDMFKAQDLDPEFRNNTAREEISGLR